MRPGETESLRSAAARPFPTSMPLAPSYPARLRATIDLPSSKSLSNRALLLAALSGGKARVERVAECDDTQAMLRALRDRLKVVDIGAAGTAMRFLTAYFAACPGEEHVMTGTERMKQRPIHVLADALRQTGADIRYEGREGYPPLRIKGRQLVGGRLRLPADVSSQFISALLMTAPVMRGGLVLELEGEIISRPYIDMTLRVMQAFGAQAGWDGPHTLRVCPGLFGEGVTYTVESDWSAASYWYEALALTPDAEARLTLPWLWRDSLQGDSAVQRYFRFLGVATTFSPEGCGVTLTKSAPGDQLPAGEMLELDLVGQPDLAQTLVVTCAMLRRPFRFTGLRSLRIKETDRIAALTHELAKYGIPLGVEGDECLYIKEYPAAAPRYNGTPIATYADHRMALAFAPTALVCPSVEIADPEVVSKSYPDFWRTLEKLACPSE